MNKNCVAECVEDSQVGCASDGCVWLPDSGRARQVWMGLGGWGRCVCELFRNYATPWCLLSDAQRTDSIILDSISPIGCLPANQVWMDLWLTDQMELAHARPHCYVISGYPGQEHLMHSLSCAFNAQWDLLAACALQACRWLNICFCILVKTWTKEFRRKLLEFRTLESLESKVVRKRWTWLEKNKSNENSPAVCLRIVSFGSLTELLYLFQSGPIIRYVPIGLIGSLSGKLFSRFDRFDEALWNA